MSEIQKKLQEVQETIDSAKKRLAEDLEKDFINALQTPGVNAYMAKNRPLSKRGTTEKEEIAKALEVFAYYGADISYLTHHNENITAPINSNTKRVDIEDFIIGESISQIHISFKPNFE